MEVDTYPPPLTTINSRLISKKRSRSSGPPSPSERTSKRLSLAPCDTYLNGSTQQSWAQNLQFMDPFRRPQDDSWVAQTRGLSINSPLLETTLMPFGTPNAKDNGIGISPGESHDVQMSVVDADENTRIQHKLTQRNPSNNSPATPSIAITEFQSSITHQHHHQSQNLTLNLSTSQMPRINILPATPSALSPTDSHGRLGSPSSPNTRKKPTLTMGPRADCEKCRMRVPGHWMHFD